VVANPQLWSMPRIAHRSISANTGLVIQDLAANVEPHFGYVTGLHNVSVVDLAREAHGLLRIRKSARDSAVNDVFRTYRNGRSSARTLNFDNEGDSKCESTRVMGLEHACALAESLGAWDLEVHNEHVVSMYWKVSSSEVLWAPGFHNRDSIQSAGCPLADWLQKRKTS